MSYRPLSYSQQYINDSSSIYYARLTLDNCQQWSIEFWASMNVLTQKRKVQKHDAKLSVSNISWVCQNNSQGLKLNRTWLMSSSVVFRTSFPAA